MSKQAAKEMKGWLTTKQVAAVLGYAEPSSVARALRKEHFGTSVRTMKTGGALYLNELDVLSELAWRKKNPRPGHQLQPNKKAVAAYVATAEAAPPTQPKPTQSKPKKEDDRILRIKWVIEGVHLKSVNVVGAFQLISDIIDGKVTNK